MTTTDVAAVTKIPVPEPDLTPEEIIARATAMIPELRERQAETEERGYFAEDTHRKFQQAGFYRILQPRMYGGYEFGIDTYYKVMIEIAKGCPSTSWCFGFSAAHTMEAASFFPEEAQDDFYGQDGEFRAPFFAGLAVRAERVDGGYYVKGAWPYSSGAPYSTHMMGHFMVSDEEARASGHLARMFVAPRSIWTMRDDWTGQLGLRGSGSNTIDVDGFVPDKWVAKRFLPTADVDGGTYGSRLHGNPMYAIRLMGFMAGELASVQTGIAYAALDEYEQIIRTRPMMFTPANMEEEAGSGTTKNLSDIKMPMRIEVEENRRNYGLALGKAATAEAVVIRCGQRLMENGRKALETGVYPPDWDLEILAMQINGGEIAMKGWLDHLFRTMGSSAAKEGQRMNRYYRDSGVFWSHLLNMMHENANTNLGTTRLLPMP